MTPGLDDPTISGRRAADGSTFDHRVGQRLFTVDIFATISKQRLKPTRANGRGVDTQMTSDVVARRQVSKVRIGFAVLIAVSSVHLVLGGLHVIRIHIADRSHLAIAQFREHLGVVPSLTSGANAADGQAIAGSLILIQAECRCRYNDRQTDRARYER